MKNPSDPRETGEALRERLIGLGERSLRKSYYPELQQRLGELERFKAFLDHSNDAIFLIEVPAARIVDLNNSVCRQLGWSREELLERSIFEVTGLAQSEPAKRLVCQREGSDGRALVETVLHRRDGSAIAAEITLDRMAFQEADYVIAVARDITERKRAEEALRKSEMQRHRLEVQLECAAQMQLNLLPTAAPRAAGFDIAASCLPAHQVGGDFYDWQETAPGLLTFTLGDVMGKGVAAAMLMATVKAALRAVSQAAPPLAALHLAERALREDLARSESFVTLFHGQLDVAVRTLSFIDCGHGLGFLRRRDGRVEELQPRGLPLGIFPNGFQEGRVSFGQGDALLLYSDGLVDALPEAKRGKEFLAKTLSGVADAEEMVERLIATVVADTQLPLPDDLTVMIILAR